MYYYKKCGCEFDVDVYAFNWGCCEDPIVEIEGVDIMKLCDEHGGTE